MIKNYISIILLFTVSILTAANRPVKTIHPNSVKTVHSGIQRISENQVFKANAAGTILSEDFSKFTAGSETTPDGTDIANFEAMDAYTLEPNWWGYGVYQAGGKAYLGYGDFSGEGEETGYMETPIIDFSAIEATVTVKIKVKSTVATGDTLLVQWYDYNDDTYQTYDYDMAEINNTWTEYTFSFDYVYQGDIVFGFYAYEHEVLIDDIEISVAGSSSITAPVATAASDILVSGFTANWNAVESATTYLLNVYTKSGANVPASDLFISEYVEGSGYNKAIEIYNGTGASIDLSSYSLKKQQNGVNDYGDELALSGTLANGDVYVVALNTASDDILAVADLATKSQAVNYNGNDAVGLFKNSVKIDEVGIFNQVADWGKDLTLIRKATVASPKSTYDTNEWDVEAKDYIANLGAHNYNGFAETKTAVAGSPFSAAGTSFDVTGLTENNTYYYTVVAQNEGGNSAASNEITVNLGTDGLGLVKTLGIYAAGGKLIIPDNIPEAIEIYHISGKKMAVYPAQTQQISLSSFEKGVYLIKAGDSIQKIIF